MSIATDITRIGTAKNNIKAVINKDFNKITNQTIDAYANKLQDTYDEYNTYVPWEHKNGDEFVLNKGGSGSYLKEFNLKGNIKQSILPEGYTQVDYIESSGTQYIDTNYYPNANTRIVIDSQSSASSKWLFGSRTEAGATDSFGVHVTGSGYWAQIGSNSTTTQIDVPVNNVRNIIDVSGTTLKVNGETKKTYENILTTGAYPIRIFGIRQNSVDNRLFVGKIYSMKIYDDNILVKNFIPCYRNSDNIIGLYDLINNVFYTNQGTGTFTYGALAPTPDTPVDIRIVKGNNTIKVTGKNLLDTNLMIKFTPNNANWWSLDGKGQFYNATNIAKSNLYYDLKANTTYTFSIYQHKNVSTSTSSPIQLVNPNGNVVVSIKLIDEGLKKSFTTTNAIRVYPRIYTNEANVLTQCIVQLEEGSTATEYQPYQEQTYPIALHGKNLFDGEYEIGGYNVNTGIKETNTRMYRSVNSISVKPNTQYQFSINGTTITEQPRYFFYDINKNKLSSIVTSGSFTTPDNCYYLTWHSSALKTDYPNGLSKTQIEEGSVATAYEPYYNYELCKIGDYKDEIRKSTGKNLWGGFTPYSTSSYEVDFTTNADGSIYANGTSTGTALSGIVSNLYSNGIYKTLPAGTYTASKNSTDVQLQVYDSNSNPLLTVLNANLSGTFTLTEETNVIIRIRVSNGTSINEIVKIQLEQGSQATDYELFGKVWYLKKNIGKVVLDSSEDWQIFLNVANSNLFRIDFAGYEKNQIIYCNYYKGLAQQSNRQNFNIYLRNDSNKLDILDNRFTTVEDFKTWLSNNPITIYYTLATLTYEKITNETLISQLEAIKKLDTYDNCTAVAAIGDSINPELEIVLFSNPAYQKWLNNQTINQEEV